MAWGIEEWDLRTQNDSRVIHYCIACLWIVIYFLHVLNLWIVIYFSLWRLKEMICRNLPFGLAFYWYYKMPVHCNMKLCYTYADLKSVVIGDPQKNPNVTHRNYLYWRPMAQNTINTANKNDIWYRRNNVNIMLKFPPFNIMHSN